MLWQTDFTYLRVISWGSYYLSTHITPRLTLTLTMHSLGIWTCPGLMDTWFSHHMVAEK